MLIVWDSKMDTLQRDQTEKESKCDYYGSNLKLMEKIRQLSWSVSQEVGREGCRRL